jgi:hypothetical protein
MKVVLPEPFAPVIKVVLQLGEILKISLSKVPQLNASNNVSDTLPRLT